ncbi:apyrase-like isoform X4 [Stomoxys calcitrans]|uniref:apyrase-like isoform X4 n=1 Tax=Stomoxys calcitrans TaxID=35570 RepID=UPI0027E27F96|nr:apyrase-like isoform X4 [Stomoxys calcitrans]
MKAQFLLVALVLFLTGNSIATAFADSKSELFPLSIIHINDFHARYEPTDTSGGACEAPAECIGGYARTVYTVRHLLEQQKDKNAVYFNAGDSFQGTLWYNVGRWNVTSEFLNLLPADAMTLGNHEFDHGIDGVVPFLESLESPMLVANIDASNEPTMVGKYKPSMILERNGRKIGVIGVILETTYDLANTGKLIFRNESDAILEEAAKLKAQGANIIIVLSHCGYDVDKIIAQRTGSVVDVIVGSHSHTFLFTGDNPPGPDKPRGDYPTIIDHNSGRKVLIVQAGAYAKYVGNITVYFNNEGNVIDFEGAPLYMGNEVPEDPIVLEALKPWHQELSLYGNRVLGTSRVYLQQKECAAGECNLGNFYTDAMVHAFIDKSIPETSQWTNVAIALTTQGNFRVPLPAGNITYNQLVTMCPWDNALYALTLQGSILRELLEDSIAPFTINKTSSSRFLQVSGLKITYNVTQAVGSRIQELAVRCTNCLIPRYKELEMDSVYRVVVMEYLANGKNGFNLIKDNAKDLKRGPGDLEAFIEFMKHQEPITASLEGRIKIVY